MADPLVIIAPFSLRSALQILITVKLDHLGEIIRIYAAALGTIILTKIPLPFLRFSFQLAHHGGS